MIHYNFLSQVLFLYFMMSTILYPNVYQYILILFIFFSNLCFQLLKYRKSSSKSISNKQYNKNIERKPEYFSRDNIQMANRHIKTWTVSLVMRETHQNNKTSPHTCQNCHHQKVCK